MAEKIDFGEVYLSCGLQHIHRLSGGTECGLLAAFAVFELLHNLKWFVDELNHVNTLKEKGTIVMAPTRTGMGPQRMRDMKYPNPDGSFSGMPSFDWYAKRIEWLKEGRIEVRPEVYQFFMKRKTKKNKEKLEKQAAERVLEILAFPKNILQFLETGILAP